ncbi:MAG: hypothetical protein ABL951_04830 [Alphaproteobacteria bacterium]
MTLSLRSKEILTGIAVPLVALCIFSLGEAALRFSNIAKFGTVGMFNEGNAFVLDPVTQLRIPRPNAKMGVIQFNSHGFRGPEVALAKPPSTLRIAFLGNSTTLDLGIPEDSTWVAIASAELAKRAPSGCRVEYINAALPGTNVPRLTQYFASVVQRFKPDLTVVMPGDVENDNEEDLKVRGYDREKVSAPSWVAQKSLLWAKIEKNLLLISLQRKVRQGIDYIEFDEQKHAAIFKRRLIDLVKEMQAHDSMAALVSISGYARIGHKGDDQTRALEALLYNPFTSIEDLLAGREAYNASILEVANEQNTLLVNTQSSIPPDEKYFIDNVHFTILGSAMHGKLVSDAIASSSRFPELLEKAGGDCAKH